MSYFEKNKIKRIIQKVDYFEEYLELVHILIDSKNCVIVFDDFNTVVDKNIEFSVELVETAKNLKPSYNF